MSTNSLVNHGIMCVSTKDPHSLSFRQITGGYLEAILPKIGLRKMVITMVIILQMIKLGYFLFTINHNSKLDKQTKRYTTITNA